MHSLPRNVRFWSLAISLIAAVALTSCTKAPATPPVSNTEGASQTQSASESRFAVFSPALGEMLQGLGFEDSIVGKHSFDLALSDSIPVMGSHIEIDYELLITLEPTDLFFEQNTTEIPERVRTLASANGWQIWTYRLNTLDDIAGAVDDLYLKLVGFPEKTIDDTNFMNPDLDPTSRFEIELPSARLARAWSPIGRDAAGARRVLLLASVDPPGAMGPGSFHAQLLDRLGITPAIDDGAQWQELDYEDIIALAPDSIIVFMPRALDADDLIGEPIPMDWATISAKLGGIARLPIPAAENHQIAIIDDPLGLLPSTSLARVADEIRAAIEGWKP